MEYSSLEELGHHISEEDVLLEGTITLTIDVSIERCHQHVYQAAGKPIVRMGEGWLVSLALPSAKAVSLHRTLFNGEPQMICDVRYAGEEQLWVHLDDAFTALGIDPQAKIWKVRSAP